MGLVTLPVSAPGYLRLRAVDHAQGEAPAVSSLHPASTSAGLDGIYDVAASSSDVASMVLTPAVIDLLRQIAQHQRGVHIAIGHRELVVAIEARRSWFTRPSRRFGVEAFVEMAGTLAIVEDLARHVHEALVAAGRARD